MSHLEWREAFECVVVAAEVSTTRMRSIDSNNSSRSIILRRGGGGRGAVRGEISLQRNSDRCVNHAPNHTAEASARLAKVGTRVDLEEGENIRMQRN